jgi:transposase-like protein
MPVSSLPNGVHGTTLRTCAVHLMRNSLDFASGSMEIRRRRVLKEGLSGTTGPVTGEVRR